MIELLPAWIEYWNWSFYKLFTVLMNFTRSCITILFHHTVPSQLLHAVIESVIVYSWSLVTWCVLFIGIAHAHNKSSKARSGESSPTSVTTTANQCCSRSESSSSSMSHLVDHTDFVYADFVKFKDNTPTFRASDYSWESHGFCIANRFCNDIGIVLDEKFTVAKEFTYNTWVMDAWMISFGLLTDWCAWQ